MLAAHERRLAGGSGEGGWHAGERGVPQQRGLGAILAAGSAAASSRAAAAELRMQLNQVVS